MKSVEVQSSIFGGIDEITISKSSMTISGPTGFMGFIPDLHFPIFVDSTT